jgi:hypothetical protein
MKKNRNIKGFHDSKTLKLKNLVTRISKINTRGNEIKIEIINLYPYDFKIKIVSVNTKIIKAICNIKKGECIK